MFNSVPSKCRFCIGEMHVTITKYFKMPVDKKLCNSVPGEDVPFKGWETEWGQASTYFSMV